jgi:hypothetical protein
MPAPNRDHGNRAVVAQGSGGGHLPLRRAMLPEPRSTAWSQVGQPSRPESGAVTERRPTSMGIVGRLTDREVPCPRRQHQPPATRCRRRLPGPARHARAYPESLGALGWTLWPYEADIDYAPATLVQQGLMSQAFSNWREAEQAHNLAAVLAGLAPSDRLLVWCGNGHASKVAGEDWTSMGHHFADLVAEGLRDRPDGDGGLCGP